MDDAARKEAIDLFETLSSRLVGLNYQVDRWVRDQSESWVKDLNWAVTRVFGSDNTFSQEIAGRKLYYSRANDLNRERYFDRDRELFLSILERILYDLRLNRVTKATDSEQKSKESPKENTLVTYPLWKGRFEVETDLVFLAMPFSESWSNDVWETIRGIVDDAGMRCLRGDESTGSDVMEDVWEGICKARVVIADLTSKNPNVAYEVGLADVLGKDVILLTQTPKDVPFDFLRKRLIPYTDSISGSNKLKAELLKRLKKYTT